MAAISAHDITKVYGRGENRFEALKGLSLSIEQGEAVAIVGKSGSGKSTLMHILALLDTPDTGELFFGDRNVRDIPRHEIDRMRNEHYGFVFQQFFLNGRESVLANVVLPLKIAKVGRRRRNERGMAALEAVGLADKAKNRANDLSGGQKQRVVIARALINEPKIIFADEPTGNLDTATGTAVEQLLFDLNRNHGITLIVVTHDEELARRFDRQIHVRDGLIVDAERTGVAA